MRAAAAFTTLMFCVCAVLAVAYLKSHQPNVVRVSPDKPTSQQEFDERVAREVQKRLDELQISKQKKAANQLAQDQPTQRRVIKHSQISPRLETARASRRPFTPRERLELASDLRLVTSTDDDDLDLVGDSNRPRP